MVLSLGNVAWISSKPILKLVINGGIGIVLAKTGILNPNSAKALSKLIVNLLLPCLLFYNLVNSIRVDNLKQMGILAFVIFFYIVLGGLWGIIYRFTFKLPRNFRNGFIAASIWGNWGDLPLAVMSSLGSTAPFKPGDAEVGVTYMSVFIVMFNLSLFTLGGYKLVASDHKNSEIDEEMATEVESKDINKPSVTVIKGVDTDAGCKIKMLNEASCKRGRKYSVTSYNDKSLPVSPPPPPIFEVNESNSEEDDYIDLSYYFKPHKPYQPYHPQQPHQPLPSHRNPISAINTPVPSKKNDVEVDYFHGNPPQENRYSYHNTANHQASNYPRKGSVVSTVPSFHLPSIYEANPVRPTVQRTRTYTSISDFQPISDIDRIDPSVMGKSIHTRRTYSTIGDFDKSTGERANTTSNRVVDILRAVFSPQNIAIILGITVGLAPPLKKLFVQPPSSNTEPPLLFLFELIRMIGAAYLPISLCNLGAALSRLSIRAVPLRITISFALVKLVLTPIIGILFVQALVYKFHIISPEDRPLRFLSMFAACVPTATSIMILSQFFSPNGETREVAAVLVVQYIIGIFTMVGSLIYILNLLG
ncbi:Protein M3 [Basidiobolus ranarum]|uniref:Protein M3 n=1 Tax=Basidiobolus ranarum TaxID=34480 RepID=A0ABR2WK79_9FUNG